MKKTFLLLIIPVLFLTACTSAESTPTPSSSSLIIPGASSQATKTPTNTKAVEPIASDKNIHVIYDDDGSRDGTAALLYLLSLPEISVDAISISYGEAHPEVYIQHIGRLLENFGITDIPLGAGQDAPLAGSNAFPDWLRQLTDVFWNIPLPNADKPIPFQRAPELMVSILNEASDPVTLYIVGPFTNLAQALRIDPGIKKNIGAVYFMGGAVYAPGNITNLLPDSSNKVAEWNIYADPLAAKEVFEAGLEMYMIPLDATNQVIHRQEEVTPWHLGDEKASFVADLYDIMFDEYGFETVEIFDLTAAVIMVRPDLCAFEFLHLDVITEDGDTIGQTLVDPDSEPNIYVCLEPDIALVKQHLDETFSP